ncbi:MAG: transposase, partial [Mycobacterium sp.]|nr:transposase [Mycobacterium sp.]
QMLPGADVVAGRPVWAIDGTNWPRPAAHTSSDRTWEYRPLAGWPHTGVVPAWAYHWLVAVPDAAGSWVLPLDVQRRGPTDKSATNIALEQIAAVRTAQPAGSPRPVVTLDSDYDLETLARARVDADLLVRLIKSRVVYRPPVKRAGRGRPRLHGTPLRLTDERTHGMPRQSGQLDHPLYGVVNIDAWSDLHVRGGAGCSLQRHPRPGRTPAQDEAEALSLVVGVDRRSAPGWPERPLALLPASLHR